MKLLLAAKIALTILFWSADIALWIHSVRLGVVHETALWGIFVTGIIILISVGFWLPWGSR